MRLRHALLITPVAVLALIGAGCGGGGSKTAASTTAAASGGGDAATILNGIKPVSQQGPQKIALNVAVTLNGQLKDPTAAALLGSGPISIDLSGPVDVSGKAADLTFGLKAGKLNLAGGLRVAGDKGFLQLNGKWYALPAGSFTTTSTGTTASGVDPAKLLEALGAPSALVKNATVVGSEDVEGIATDHVAGDVDTAALVGAIGRLAGAVDTKSSPIDPKQVADATAKLQQFVKSAKVDVWIGKVDKQLHRIKIDADIAFDAATKTSSGLDGIKATVSLSSTPTASPNVTAPAGALPSDQLSKDLGALLLSGLTPTTP